jgi:hypothetical protein
MIVPPWFFMLIYFLGMNNRTVGGRSSETKSHPINMIVITIIIKLYDMISLQSLAVIVHTTSFNNRFSCIFPHNAYLSVSHDSQSKRQLLPQTTLTNLSTQTQQDVENSKYVESFQGLERGEAKPPFNDT